MRLLPEEPAVRRMALVTLVNTTGNGIFFTLSALYFTRIVGFSVVQVGTGLSIAAGVAILAGIPMGHLADRRGPREVMVALLVLTAACSGLYLLVQSWWQFVLVSTLVAVLDRGAGAVRGALIAGLVQGATRSATRAYLRSVTNVGMTLGTGIAAIALHFDTRSAYLTVLYVDVATYAVCAGLMLMVPTVRPRPAEEALGMLHALRDLPFVTVAGVELGACDALLDPGAGDPAVGGRPHRGAAGPGGGGHGRQHGDGRALPGVAGQAGHDRRRRRRRDAAVRTALRRRLRGVRGQRGECPRGWPRRCCSAGR